MSNLDPSMLVLDKGLNLQTAKIVAPPGSILDTINYEQVDFQGHKRIDGYARYDGSLVPALDEYYKIVVASTVFISNGALAFLNNKLFGVVVGWAYNDDNNTDVYIGIIDHTVKPQVSELLNWSNIGDDGVLSPEAPSAILSVALGLESGVTPQEHYENLLAFTSQLRLRVESLPGFIIGLQWFRDRLYAVADVTTIFVSINVEAQIHPNDTIATLDGLDFVFAKVLDTFIVGGAIVVFLSAMDPSQWMIGNPIYDNDNNQIGEIVDGQLAIETQIASFFESRTEQQVLTEDGPSGPYDFGWRFVDLGWIVNFENGVSLFGNLPSLNQNIQGLGIQGPTSTAGNNGRALTLLQKVVINGEPKQVNGWKSSQTPTSYQLDPDNLTDIDSFYIYGDAFLAWNGATGVISAPGIAGAIPEYPATSTVEVLVP